MVRVVPLLIGALFIGIGGMVLAFFVAGFAREGLDAGALFAIVPAVFVVIGALLVVLSLRGMLRSRQRRAMPLAVVRHEPVAAGVSRWEFLDVASAIARRLQDSPCSVHHAGEQIEIRWAAESAGQERCELRDAGDGVLSHADVLESAFEVRRRHRGSVLRLGPRQRGRMDPLTSSSFDTLDRRAVHAAIDEALAVAGWSREG